MLAICVPSCCSLIKMVSAFSQKSRLEPTWPEMVHAIKRNFGGLDWKDFGELDCKDFGGLDCKKNPVAVFERNLQNMDKDREVSFNLNHAS